ncbi:hypothetical protein D3C85_1543820 [compost metagenome]
MLAASMGSRVANPSASRPVRRATAGNEEELMGRNMARISAEEDVDKASQDAGWAEDARLAAYNCMVRHMSLDVLGYDEAMRIPDLKL